MTPHSLIHKPVTGAFTDLFKIEKRARFLIFLMLKWHFRGYYNISHSYRKPFMIDNYELVESLP